LRLARLNKPREPEPKSIGTFVPGEGPQNARIMLIGQNPGSEEAKQGRPFVGKSGKYLDTVLRENNVDRRNLYLTSVVKETTPGNRKPTAQEIRYWMPYLLEEVRQVKPKVVVLMGKIAWETPRLKAIEYIETYHPAAAMRFPRARERFENDFERLRREVSNPASKAEQETRNKAPTRYSH
jgi:DNA polymerase